MTVYIGNRSPNIIPHLNFWGKADGTVASIDSVTKHTVTGHLQYDGGISIPFEANHDHSSFQVGTSGPRFYFSNWKK